jgi:hypothetical protein
MSSLRYSQLYIDQPNPLPDSARARHRLAKLLEKVTNSREHAYHLGEFLEAELGISVNVSNHTHWERFCAKAAIRDFLDAITLTHTYLLRSGLNGAFWRGGVRRIFLEEGLSYEIDDSCIVHPSVDREFQRNRHAAVACLQDPRYANSLAAFERVSDELSSQPPNGKDAWRAIFAAVEGLFRLMFSSAHQLNSSAVETNLTPLVQKLYGADVIAVRAAVKQIASLKDWVDASHNYRHEPGSEEPVQPPIDLAILAISNGTSFLRWLIGLDQSSRA